MKTNYQRKQQQQNKQQQQQQQTNQKRGNKSFWTKTTRQTKSFSLNKFELSLPSPNIKKNKSSVQTTVFTYRVDLDYLIVTVI